MPWLKIIGGIVLMGLGAAIAVWGYATPRIDGLQSQMAQNAAKNAEATAAFLKDSQARMKELQDERDKVAADYAAQKAASDKLVSSLRGDIAGLRGNIARYTSSLALRLPATAKSAPGIDDSAIAGWDLLGACLSVAETSAGQAEQLANQVRGLQALEK